MSQSFPEITGETYIDSGILALQDRDNANLTWFSGDVAPSNPFEDLVWNDTHNKCIKWYHNSAWETVIDYGLNYITTTNLAYNYQPLNSNLTTYSGVTHSGTGFITNEWIPMSSFFINKLSKNVKNNIGLNSLAYKSKLTQNDIDNNSISESKLTTEIETTPVFRVGDVIPSFNQGNKAGCVKLSKTANTKFTVGATASNSTYKGDTYKNLFQFIWSSKFIAIYNSNGKAASKGSTWTADWNNNKQLELPHIDLPDTNVPKTLKLTNGTNINYKITKSGYYYITIVGGGGGGSAMGAGTSGHQASCCGASAGAFKGEVLLNENDIINYTIGTGGRKATGSDWGYPGAVAEDGKNTVIKLNGSNLVTAFGGGGAQTWWRSSWTSPTGGSATIHQANKFTPNTTVIIKGADGHGYNHWGWQTVAGPLNNDYGVGGSATAGSDYNPEANDGNGGFFSLEFLAPKEYGSSDSGRKKLMDGMYNSITYFMKY